MTNPRSSFPLQGLKVLDMAEERGEMCGRLLADLGADVVRVEPPGGSPSRRLGPHAPDGTSLYFAYRNANKRSIAVDLTSAADRSVFDELLGWADVWVETSAPGSLNEAGLDPTEVSRRFPHLVVLSMTDFGQDGPYRDYRGTDAVLQAMSGLLFRAGVPERPPLLQPGSLAYDGAAVTGCFAVLVALWRRKSYGGTHLDLSVIEAAAQMSDWTLPLFSWVAGLGVAMPETRSGSGTTYRYYRCTDGFVRLITMTVRQWRLLCDWIDAPDWLREPHWDNPVHRAEITDVLDDMLNSRFAAMTRLEATHEAQTCGLPVTPVLTPSEVLSAPHYTERQTFITDAEIAPGLMATAFGGFTVWDGQRLGLRRRAPEVDEHRDAVLDAARSAQPISAPGGSLAPAADPPADPVRLPLAGIRVLDFGVGGVGPEAGRMLADYGAEVIKVESRTYPDFIRVLTGREVTPSFVSSSRGKLSLGINLKTEDGKALMRRLVSEADVLVENSAPGVMDRLGLSPEACRRANPRLVHVSSRLMGHDGPWAHWVGYGPSTHAPSGLSHLWNFEETADDAPPGSQTIFPDHLAGRLCAMAALAGLLARDRTGEGFFVEVAQVETTIGLLGDLLIQESIKEGSARPQGNRSDRGAPWGVYPCSGDEQWCVITVTDDEAWVGLREEMGDPNWAAEPELATAAGRLARSVEIDERVAAWTRGHDAQQLMDRLQARGVSAGFMMYSSQMRSDPHLVARGFPVRFVQPDLGELVLEGPAFHSSSFPDPVPAPSPALGEHTRDICRRVLGLTDERIEHLERGGVLECS